MFDGRKTSGGQEAGMAHRVSAAVLAIGILALLFCAGLAVAGGTRSAAGATAAATTTTSSSGTTTTTTTASGAVISLKHGSSAVIVLLIVVALLLAVWFGLILFDRIRAERRMDKYLPVLIEQASRRDSDPPLTSDQVKLLARVIADSPRGATGLTRTTLALGLITLIGMALIALIVGDGSHASDLLKSIVTALTAALTTILGFYFGAKTATDASTAATAAAQQVATDASGKDSGGSDAGGDDSGGADTGGSSGGADGGGSDSGGDSGGTDTGGTDDGGTNQDDTDTSAHAGRQTTTQDLQFKEPQGA